ncbi:NAD-dependent succinate-semialdehyde dehydrogenase [Terriglobus roseus]|uniref:Succinate semialdehyde dehydrogenase n=1 Tax=Terriglobus roseus TaxID=392734 RepID=A0A1H4Q8B8_9BACT|nr:NAD-dependent succinate-semialdehyde dehydrogenase [Terriglobus roseus]SEC15856.1 succinate semialdehyde dehydrogenase [Terriglobus roseus]
MRPSVTYTAADASFSINPATGEEIARHAYLRGDAIDHLLQASQSGFVVWSAMPIAQRLGVLQSMATVLRSRLEPMAQTVTQEMGKPIVQARAEVEKCASLCDWYAQNGEAMLADEPTSIGTNAYVSYLPLGSVLGVMPWNFPYWQVMRSAVGVLLSGNAYVLKHAPNVMLCAHLLADAWRVAGLPDGAFTLLHADNEGISRAIADRRIAGVMVTGSVRAGSAIAAQAGGALKKSVLEMGGSDPLIVLADADIERAADAAITGRFQNTGQVCIAAKRILLHASIADEFLDRFVTKTKALVMGDPTRDETYLGPMARFDLRDAMAEQVRQSQAEGAKTLLAGGIVEGRGNFYAPTILADVTRSMTCFREEVFGPVASLISVRDASEALALANDSEFGLCASLWTEDRTAAKQFARQLQAGGLFLNSIPVSDPRVPIGGVKHSGYGRELSHFGVREFTNAQTVWFDRT